MPEIATYGVEVNLQSSAAATPSSSARHNQGKQQTAIIEESATNPIWIPSAGMNHPIWVTTVRTPVKTPSEAAVPMKVVVNFGDPNELPDYMRGDMRVELTVDGVVSGLKFYREFKLKGKGFNLEFSGYRFDRTKERGFVFNALPKTFEPNGDGEKAKDLPNYGIAWIKNALRVPGPDPHQKEGEFAFGGLYPVQPLGLPPHVSCVQVLISVGKKYRTLERYFMAGATPRAAFYSPPRAPAHLSLDVEKWSQLNALKKNMHSTTVAAVEDAAGSPAQLAGTPNNRRAPSAGEQILAKSSDEGNWKPVGLGRTQKVAQAKEVEFAVRIHLCRFWFFIVSESSPDSIELNLSRMITLKVPNLKKWLEEHAKDSIADGTIMQGSGIATPGKTPDRSAMNTFMSLKALADAAAEFNGMASTSPALSDFPSLDLASNSSPQATIMDDSHHQVMPQHVRSVTSSPIETGSRGGPAGAEEKTEPSHKRKVDILCTSNSKPPKRSRTTGTVNHQ